ncbi:MAG: magnesium transporter [Dehalococcoidia bacterium]
MDEEEAAVPEPLPERRPVDVIDELIEDGLIDLAAGVASELRAVELAEVLDHLDADPHEELVRALPAEVVAPALEYLSARGLEDTVEHLTPEEITDTLSAVADDVATDMVQALDEDVAALVLEALPEERRLELENLLTYDEDTAGGHMTGQVVTVAPHLTAADTIVRLRELDADPSRPFYLYVTDEERHLLGVLSLRSLITSSAETPVTELMASDVVSVPASMDQEEAARFIQRHNLQSLPVVDDEGHLLGAVTADDLFDVLEEEATEDLYRLAGVSEDEDLRNVFDSIRNRLPWLVVNLGTAMLAAWVVSRFEATLAQVVVLAAFMPVVAGIGGNAGVQTLTVVVRSLAIGEILRRDTLAIIWHELRVGLTMGATVGLLVAGVAIAWVGNGWLGLVVGGALSVNVLVGVFLGVLIPMTLHRLDQDPALSGGIWLTMCTDTGGFLVYLTFATVFIDRIRG